MSCCESDTHQSISTEHKFKTDMTNKIFTVRVLSDETDDFVRDYEISADTDMLGMHNLLCDDLGYDRQGFSSFFAADDAWNKLQEYTMMDMFDEDSQVATVPMEGAQIRSLLAEGINRLIFMFDVLSGRSLYMEITDMKNADASSTYPRVAYAEGEPPLQDADGEIENDDPFGDMMSEFEGFEGTEDEDYGYDEF